MYRMHVSITAIVVLLTHTACGTLFTNNHLKMIEQGRKPKIALVVSIPDTIFVEYFGNTIAENRTYTFPSGISFKDAIYEGAKEVIKRDGVVELYQQHPEDRTVLFDNLAYEERFYWKNVELSQQDKKAITDWGRARGLDFVAFLYPGLLQLTLDHGRIIAEKGVIAGPEGNNNRMMIYAIRLYDVESLDWAMFASEKTFILRNRPFMRTLSNEEIEGIKEMRQIKIDEDVGYEITGPSLEYELKRASYYKGSDFASLTDEQLAEIDNQMYPHIKENIEQLLVKAGVAKGKNMANWSEVRKTTVERLHD
ncbi:MAG: hypothetical protein DBP03_20485 [gamma proteobacterium symbiont of Ctena orbiculata]|nr:MAG: hypothetical protein DBP03_20485 [gamma proteobacterium symbiont of Ctena orbiculata]